MAKITIKQHDITDCGAACLASIAAHYKLQISIARIRQYAGTDKNKDMRITILNCHTELVEV